jgi:hypothetical protein
LLPIREPDTIAVRFEIQAVVFLGYLAILLGLPATSPGRDTTPAG